MSDEQTATAGAQDPAQELENWKRTAAGQDRKITEYQKQIATLEERLQAVGGDAESRAAEARRLAEVVGSLKTREEELAAKEKALAVAAEKGVPVNLLLRNPLELDATLKDLAELEKGILARHGWSPGRVKRQLTAEDVRKFTRGELGRIPPHVLQKLAGL